MAAERACAGSKSWLWIQWVLASAGGFTLVWLATSILLEVHVKDPLVMVCAAAIAGAVSGAVQWLVLRQQVAGVGWQAPSIIVGWMAATAISMNTMIPPHQVDFALVLLEAVVRGPVAGVVLGLAQWLVLRRQASSTGWWVPASAVGYAIGLPIAILAILGPYGRPDSGRWPMDLYVAGAVGGAVGGTLYGAITGITLVWMLRHPAPETTGSGQSAA